ncbi:MAG TPA: hypothetical protein VKR80_04925, partial [Candidatus Limnocylindria bacterium]|nr:hypothetical protein [Candidatus Limnocylindria bacterium]
LVFDTVMPIAGSVAWRYKPLVQPPVEFAAVVGEAGLGTERKLGDGAVAEGSPAVGIDDVR